MPRSRMLSPAEVADRVPGLPTEGLTGGALWHDAQVSSSERLLIALLRAAAEEGAALANYAPVVALAAEGGRVRGATVEDREGGGRTLIRARLVLNAAGPAAGDVMAMAGVRSRIPLLRAYNLVLRRPAVRDLAVGSSLGGRFLFLVPWRDRALLGTAYRPADAAESGEPAWFLDEARRAFPWIDLTIADVALVHRGRVPGRGGAEGLWTRNRLIDHGRQGAPGLVSVLGVKYTTARGMAEAAVDLALRRLGRPLVRCRTAKSVLPWAREGGDGTLEERARAAAEDEMALHLDDAVLRRLDLGTAGAPSAADVERVARVLGDCLGWNAGRRERERRGLETSLSDLSATVPGASPRR